jgi:hypothetical protein
VLVDTFRRFYGPTMNAFEAAEAGGRAADLLGELEELYAAQSRSGNPNTTAIPVAFLRVTVMPG